MPTRRLVLEALIATPLLAILGGRAHAARRAPATGDVFEGDLIVAPENPAPPWLDPTYPVKRRGRPLVPTPAGDHVAVTRRLRVRRAHVFSLSNHGDRYLAHVDVRERIGDAMGWLVVPGGVAVSARSWSDRSVSFEVDRDQAAGLAAAWGIAVRDRMPLGGGLVGHWRTRDHHTTLGAPIVIELEVENTSATPAYFSVGGRQRGPRDNRFAFTALDPSGAAVAALEGDDFGGLGGHVEIVPGQPWRGTTELQKYLALERGGVYDVTCRYQAELVPDREARGWPEHGAETWDLELIGRVDVRLE